MGEIKNDYELIGNTALIYIRRKNSKPLIAFIDAEDLPKVSGYRWHSTKSVTGYEEVDENTHTEPLLAILFEGFQKSCPWRDRKEANANEPQA